MVISTLHIRPIPATGSDNMMLLPWIMVYVLVNGGANSGICRYYRLVLEGIEHFVNNSGITGHKVNQLHIVNAYALVTTHKGDAITSFQETN
jgi:hypothetical protein